MGDNSWTGTISRADNKLKKPSKEFVDQVKTMEKMFICYHGEKSLKPGKGAVKELSLEIANIMELPLDLVTYFVRCRTFFRIRILNRDIISSRKIVNKVKKL